MRPEIAVIIPTHNRAKFLAAALDSVRNQTANLPTEVAVIDDGSTDGTDAVVRPYVGVWGGTEIRYTRIEKSGVVAARNLGIAGTTAPWIAFLDSDDIWEVGRLEQQLKAVDADPSVGVVHSSFRYIDEDGAFTDHGDQRPDNPCRGECTGALLREDTVLFSTVLARRDLIATAAAAEPHGLPFDPRWTNGQDYDLLLRLSLLSPFAYVTRALVRYRTHSSQAAMGNLTRVFGFHCRVQMDFARRHGARLGLATGDGERAARAFLLSRTESIYWQRRPAVVRDLCGLADELGVGGPEFDRLRRLARRPLWLLRLKDSFDRVLGRRPGTPD